METGRKWSPFFGRIKLAQCYYLKYIYLGRKYEKTRNKLLKFFLKRRLDKYKKYGLEIDFSGGDIGPGIQLVHPYGITINSKTKTGKHIVIFKGVTIGSIRSGTNKGVPTIGNNVVLCANSFIVGNITIGDNVLIAANSFVNFDVPSNSIVVGNKIHKKTAVYDYIFEKE